MFTGINLLSMFAVGFCASCALHNFCHKEWEDGIIDIGLAALNLICVFL